MGDLTIENVDKTFNQTQVLRQVSLAVKAGEFVAVLGPSGCGKTTLLRCLAGFERVDDGRISLDGRTVSAAGLHVPPETRGVGVVFQNYALWPHMTVAENVAYGLKVAGVTRAERLKRVANVLDLVELGPLANRRPADLSGGQRQRVALARCLAMESRIVLLDEPLANLDVHLRGTLEAEFAAFHARSGATMIYITHDQSEAMALADRVAVMDRGRVLQFARPQDLFREPTCPTVAGFIGEGHVIDAEDIHPIGEGRARVRLMGRSVEVRCGPRERQRQRGQISFHPGDLRLAAQPEEAAFAARVTRTTYRGAYLRTEVQTGPLHLTMTVPAPASFHPGQELCLTLADAWVLPEPAASLSL